MLPRPNLREIRDRWVASDPGGARFRTALAAAVCAGTALLLHRTWTQLAALPGRDASVVVMVGAMVAMVSANAMVGLERRHSWRSAAILPIATALGLVGATAVDSQRGLQAVGFVVVLFLAVWVRRFGPTWFHYGFQAWIGFFVATFLQIRVEQLPALLVAVLVSVAWVALLTTTAFHVSSSQALHATSAAVFARSRALARGCADLLLLPPTSVRRRARVVVDISRRRQALVEAALLADAWSADEGALPSGWSAPALRRRLIETQQAAERFAASALRLHGGDPDIVAGAAAVVDALAHHDDVGALLEIERLQQLTAQRGDDAAGGFAAQQLMFGVREFLRCDAAANEPPEVDPGEDEFEAASGLVAGRLPGSPAVAGGVAARGWINPVSRWSMSTRQAVQVALAGGLALWLGTVLSPTRYYWAVIAAFVVFAGTGTRFETATKGVSRIAGTVVGIVAAVGLAHLTVGHRPVEIAAILISIFFAFYLMKVSEWGSTFFMTVLLGQMYAILGTFSDGVLGLRLGETVVGVLAGVAVALVFAPLSTRDTVRAVRDDMLAAMAQLLEGVARFAEGDRPQPLDAMARALDDDARNLALITRPLTTPLARGVANQQAHRRLRLYIAAVSQCRALTLAVQRRPVLAPEATAAAARAVAEAARALATRPPGSVVPEAEEPLARGDLALFSGPAAGVDDDPVVRHLHHLAATLTQVAQTHSIARAAA